MRKLPVVSGVFIAGALAVAACSGTTTPTVPPINVPTLPPVNVPTLPPINLPSLSLGSFSLPSFSIPSFSIPSYDANADPALAAKFPTTINGAPVTDLTTVNFVQFFSAFSQTDPNSQAQMQQLVTVLQNGGIDPTTLAFGNAEVEIDSNAEQIAAFHTPGASGATLLNLFPQLAALEADNETQPTIAQANVGGKTVTTVDDGSGSIDYLYPSGDILWDVSTDNPNAAALIMAAVQ
ncbi:MAG TPA: hypothetical protein VH371_03615 [Candidatus Limnocylindrales bacterium]|jgi:hypothetical protein